MRFIIAMSENLDEPSDVRSLLPKLGIDSVASAGYHTLGGFELMLYGYILCVPPHEVHWAEMQWFHGPA